MESHEDIKSQLCEILKPFAKDGRELQEETDLVADLGLDSLKVMTLLVEVEDNFDISVPLNVLPEVRTVKDFVLQIEQLLEEGQ
jgi:acyl carrier protein